MNFQLPRNKRCLSAPDATSSFFHLLVNGFSVTSFRTFSKTPYLYYTGGQGGIKMASSKNNQLIARNNLILVHAVQLKPAIKVQISGRMASITASVYSEKTRMKKLMMKMIIIFIIIMNKSQETTIFHGHQKLTSAMKQRPEK